MKRKLLFTIVLFLGSFIACYSQNNETLGDNAMSSGNYSQAVTYYLNAMSQHPSDALSGKLIKATVLKNEFNAIDEAVANRNTEALNMRTANILLTDPSNKFINSKKNQLSSNLAKDKVINRQNNIHNIFFGNDAKQNLYDFMSFDQGIGYIHISGMEGSQGLDLAQRFQMRFYTGFPIVLDFHNHIGWDHNHQLWGLGIGSCFFLGNHITLDYGIGFQRNAMEFNGHQKVKGRFYRAGVTLMGNHGMGLNYSYYHYTGKECFPFNSHQITGIFTYNQKHKLSTVLAGGFFLWHIVAAGIVYQFIRQ